MKRRDVDRLHSEVLNGFRDFAWPLDDYRGTGLREEFGPLIWQRLLELKQQGHPIPADRAYYWAREAAWQEEEANRLAGIAWAVEHCVGEQERAGGP